MRFFVGISLSVGLLVLWPSYVLAVTIAPISVGTSSPIIGDAFSVTASASGGLAGTVYFVKCRIGATSSSLSDGQTRNPQISQWLDDTGSTGAWADMPQVTIGQDGTWQGDMECRIKNGAVDEAKALFLRACLNANNSCGTSFQSASSLALNPIVPTPTPTPVPTATPTPSPTPVPTSTPDPTPTKTPTPTPSPKATATPTPTITPVMTTLATSASAATPSRRPTPSPEATLEDPPSVLGESVVSEESSPSSYVQNTLWKPIVISLLLIAMGLAILSGFYTWKIAREKYLQDQKSE